MPEHGGAVRKARRSPYFSRGGQFGNYFDIETGLVLCGQRYYDSSNGRWINRDPIGTAGGLNLYAYVGNNPVNRIDPSGRSDDSLTASVRQAIARADAEELEAILEASEDVMSEATRDLAKNAIQRLRSTAQDWISKKCKGSIRGRFPKEMLEKTIEQIEKLAKAGNKAAQTAKKLLSDGRFKK